MIRSFTSALFAGLFLLQGAPAHAALFAPADCSVKTFVMTPLGVRQERLIFRQVLTVSDYLLIDSNRIVRVTRDLQAIDPTTLKSLLVLQASSSDSLTTISIFGTGYTFSGASKAIFSDVYRGLSVTCLPLP